MKGHIPSFNKPDQMLKAYYSKRLMNNYLRQQYLDAIGIQIWQLKTALNDEMCDSLDDVSDIAEEKTIAVLPTTVQASQTFTMQAEPVKPESEQVSKVQIEESHNRPVEDKTVDDKTVTENIECVPELELTIKQCKQCPGRQTRLNALSGQGNAGASVFIISEAPTAEEDRSGHYLTEQTMSLFQSMFHSINSIDDYFITGIIKCYSLSEYLVSKDEISRCSTFLHAQIEQVKPSVILVLGAVQAQTVLQSDESFNQLRGKIHYVTINDKEYPVIVSYHPAYLVRNPIYKREALKDLIMIKELIK